MAQGVTFSVEGFDTLNDKLREFLDLVDKIENKVPQATSIMSGLLKPFTEKRVASFSTFVTSLNKIKSESTTALTNLSIKEMPGMSKAKAEGYGAFFTSLSKIKGIETSSFTQLSDGLRELSQIDGDKLEKVVNAFSTFSQNRKGTNVVGFSASFKQFIGDISGIKEDIANVIASVGKYAEIAPQLEQFAVAFSEDFIKTVLDAIGKVNIPDMVKFGEADKLSKFFNRIINTMLKTIKVGTSEFDSETLTNLISYYTNGIMNVFSDINLTNLDNLDTSKLEKNNFVVSSINRILNASLKYSNSDLLTSVNFDQIKTTVNTILTQYIDIVVKQINEANEYKIETKNLDTANNLIKTIFKIIDTITAQSVKGLDVTQFNNTLNVVSQILNKTISSFSSIGKFSAEKLNKVFSALIKIKDFFASVNVIGVIDTSKVMQFFKSINDVFFNSRIPFKNIFSNKFEKIINNASRIDSKKLEKFKIFIQSFESLSKAFSNLDKIKNVNFSDFNRLVDNIVNSFGKRQSRLMSIISGGKLGSFYNTGFFKLINELSKLKFGNVTSFAQFSEGLSKLSEGFVNFSKLEGSDLTKTANQMVAAMKIISNNVGKGFISGLFGTLLKPITAIPKTIYTVIVGGIKNLFKIASPSKVMISLGQDIGKGFFIGIKNIISTVPNLVKGIFNKILSPFTSFANFIKNRFVITLQDVQNQISNLSRTMFTNAIDFETNMTKVLKTMDVGDDQVAGFTEELRNLAFVGNLSGLENSSEQILQIAEAGGSLGIPIENMKEFVTTAGQMAIATNLSADEAATFFGEFGAVSKSKDFNAIGSTMVALGNNFAATEKQIAEMSQRLIAAGSSAGLTIPQVLALSTAMTSVGINAEAGGTAMTEVINEMVTATANGGSSLNTFARIAGTSSKEFADTWNQDASAALNSFVVGLGELEAAEQIKVLDQLGLDGARVSLVLRSLASSETVLGDAIKVANSEWETQSALAGEAIKANDTTRASINRFYNTMKDLSITIGNLFSPAIKTIFNTMSDFAIGLNTMLKNNIDTIKTVFMSLYDTVKNIAKNIYNVLNVFLPLDKIADKLKQIVDFGKEIKNTFSESPVQAVGGIEGSNISNSFTKEQVYKIQKGDTLTKIAKDNKITVEELMKMNNLTSSLIIEGNTLITSKATGNIDTLNNVAKNLTGTSKIFANVLNKIFGVKEESVVGFFDKYKEFMDKTNKAISKAFLRIKITSKQFKNLISSIFSGDKKLFTKSIENIKIIFTKTFKQIAKWFSNLDIIKDVKLKIKSIFNFSNAAKDEIAQGEAGLFGKLRIFVMKLRNTIINLLNPKTFFAEINKLFDIKNIIDFIINRVIGGFIGAPLMTIGKILTEIYDNNIIGIKDFIDNLKINETIEKIINFIKSLFGYGEEDVESEASNENTPLHILFGSIKTLFDNIKNTVTEFISNVDFSGIDNFVKELVRVSGLLVNGVFVYANWIIENVITPTWNNIVDFIDYMVNNWEQSDTEKIIGIGGALFAFFNRMSIISKMFQGVSMAAAFVTIPALITSFSSMLKPLAETITSLFDSFDFLISGDTDMASAKFSEALSGIATAVANFLQTLADTLGLWDIFSSDMFGFLFGGKSAETIKRDFQLGLDGIAGIWNVFWYNISKEINEGRLAIDQFVARLQTLSTDENVREQAFQRLFEIDFGVGFGGLADNIVKEWKTQITKAGKTLEDSGTSVLDVAFGMKTPDGQTIQSSIKSVLEDPVLFSALSVQSAQSLKKIASDLANSGDISNIYDALFIAEKLAPEKIEEYKLLFNQNIAKMFTPTSIVESVKNKLTEGGNLLNKIIDTAVFGYDPNDIVIGAGGSIVVKNDIGKNIVDGISKGVEDNSNIVDTTFATVSEGWKESIKDIWGIESPSTVTQEYGLFLMEGLQIGIDLNKILVETALTSVTDLICSIKDEMRNTVFYTNIELLKMSISFAIFNSSFSGVVDTFGKNSNAFKGHIDKLLTAVKALLGDLARLQVAISTVGTGSFSYTTTINGTTSTSTVEPYTGGTTVYEKKKESNYTPDEGINGFSSLSNQVYNASKGNKNNYNETINFEINGITDPNAVANEIEKRINKKNSVFNAERKMNLIGRGRG